MKPCPWEDTFSSQGCSLDGHRQPDCCAGIPRDVILWADMVPLPSWLQGGMGWEEQAVREEPPTSH